MEMDAVIMLTMLVIGCLGGLAISDEKKLIKKLIGEYQNVGLVGRPVKYSKQTMNVTFGLALIQILDLDERNQVLTANYWNRIGWHDYLLRWNPEEFGGVSEVRVPPSSVWLPDIVLYNYADDRLKEYRDAMVVVSYTGDVMWIPQAIYKSSCPIDIKHFPFDEQNCKLKFGSWTYDGFEVDLFFENDEKIDLTEYVKSNEWNILESPAVKHKDFYPCCPEPFVDLTFYLKIKRKVAFYNYILILPCVLLSSLTLVLFWLPPESPAKMQLGMNIFVAFFVLLLLLAESTPPASASIPLIGAYYCLNMIMIALSTFLSVIVIQLYFRGDRATSLPRWIKRIMVDGLAKVLCMGVESPNDDLKPEEVKSLEDKERISKDLKTMRQKGKEMKYNKYQMVDQMEKLNCRANGRYDATPDMSPIHFHQGMESDVKDIRKVLRHIVQKMNEKERVAKIQKEWKTVALVLDRIFFILYLIAIIVSLCTIFPKTG